eukprot:11188525-Lingulodinium_polyedra.AAC.1
MAPRHSRPAKTVQTPRDTPKTRNFSRGQRALCPNGPEVAPQTVAGPELRGVRDGGIDTDHGQVEDVTEEREHGGVALPLGRGHHRPNKF